MSAVAEDTHVLPDGRVLAFIRSGPPDGHHVLFCHGTPGSRRFRPPDETLTSTLGVDLVTVDRPGYGRSTPQLGRRLVDWVADAESLADQLGWERFSVAGISGGSAFALACAHRLPDRVATVGIVSGVAPFWPAALEGMLPTTRRGFQLARWAPWLLIAISRQTAKHPDRFLDSLKRQLPGCDQAVLDRPEVARVQADNVRESLVGDEMGREMVLLRRNWGFSPANITVPVLLWHGENDRNVPVAHGRQLANMLSQCHTTFVPEAGHYLIFDRWAEVLSSLTANDA